MVNYGGVLKFKGTWREYQARVLKNADKYKKDNRIHIVAAPGSGKTTLGIELMVRMSEPALVLAPSITIREQWIARIVEAFLCDGVNTGEYLSQDLKQPKAITVVTYQALHSAMTRYKGSLSEGEDAEGSRKGDADVSRKEEVDYSDFDLMGTVKAAGIRVLCLDECHHLRSEWWKALEAFKKELGEPKIIALTATPPYDSTPALWDRYMNMCGEIDEEITIPELVKEGSLCPHQDFVYFNYPTAEETAEVEKFRERGRKRMELLMQDDELLKCIQSHGSLLGTIPADKLLDKPSYFASLLIYLQARQVTVPSQLKRLLGAKRLPDMEPKWMEQLLQGFLYEDTEAYQCGGEYREQLENALKSEGLIEKRKVSLTVNGDIEKLLISSKGKCKSIRDIVAHEYGNMGKQLRLLVLTDYIRKEYEKAAGDLEKDVNALGVLPFFEQLRRENAGKNELRLGVLCGTIVIIPAEAKAALEEAVGDGGKITFSSVGKLEEQDYLKVTAVGDAHFLTGAVTDLFTKGYIQVLIGTKSLLGEGWDSPCINSLILASFVGSFMLSNQMRGRAIRVLKDQPDKTSNIWHLVCLKPQDSAKPDDSGEISEDFALLQRRMEHFLGLHYTEDVIENGMERLSVIKPPYNQANVETINRKMLELSGQRDTLKERWNRSLARYRRMDVVDETAVQDACVTSAVFQDSLRKAVLAGAFGAAMLAACFGGIFSWAGGIAGIFGAAGILTALLKVPKLQMLGSPYKRLQACGNGIKKALRQQNLLEESGGKVLSENKGAFTHSIYLSGGSGRDKALFAQCVKEFFGEVDNQRYLLVKEKGHSGLDGFYCVPECFAKRKEDAEHFWECMKPYIGNYELVYTRNEKGRGLLLEGRVRALGNREERCVSRKKVKGALE